MHRESASRLPRLLRSFRHFVQMPALQSTGWPATAHCRQSCLLEGAYCTLVSSHAYEISPFPTACLPAKSLDGESVLQPLGYRRSTPPIPPESGGRALRVTPVWHVFATGSVVASGACAHRGRTGICSLAVTLFASLLPACGTEAVPRYLSRPAGLLRRRSVSGLAAAVSQVLSRGLYCRSPAPMSAACRLFLGVLIVAYCCLWVSF